MEKDFFADHQDHKNSIGMFEQKSKVKLSLYLKNELLPALVLQVISFFVSLGGMSLFNLSNNVKISLAWILSFIVFAVWFIFPMIKLVNKLNLQSDRGKEIRGPLARAWEYERFRRSLFSLVIGILSSAVFIYYFFFQLGIFNAYLIEFLLLIGLLVGNIILQKLNYELSSYIFFGIMTAVVSLVSFSIVDKLILYFSLGNNDWNWLISQTVSFILAVLFAYITNSRYVFKSSTNFWKELREFFASRLLNTLIFEYLGIFVFINLLNLNRDFSKLMAAVLVTLANYILSKFWVFRSK